MSAHTPGPWKVGSHAPTRVFAKQGPKMVQVAEVYGAQFDDDSNTRLIAAAPDLLEELKNTASAFALALRASLSRDLYDSDEEYNAAIRSNYSLVRANAAIAKAEGKL